MIGRRELLAAAAAGMTGIASARAADAATTRPEQPALPAPKRKAVLKLAAQEAVIPGRDLTEKLDAMEKWGFDGIEFHGRSGDKLLADRVDEIKDAMKGRKLKVAAICAGFSGCLIGDTEGIRDLAMNTIRDILIPAGELGSTGMIVVPAFHNQTKVPDQQARDILVLELKELGDRAAKAGTRVLLEPLNRQECYFLRMLADAASICRDVNNPGIAMMGDFWHMTWEETSDLGAFLSAGDHLHHVHIASRKTRATPGEDEGDNYVLGFKGLKLIGYQDFVSFECGTRGDKQKAIPAAVKMLREQWEKA